MTIRAWRSASATPGRWPRWRRWGFGGSRFWKAVIISKPGPSPRLYWAPSIHSAMIDCTLSRASW